MRDLRFLTCGSVDDGKSTLMGRLLVDADMVSRDQRDAVTHQGVIDYAQLMDGLSAEREQGITIDIAHRYFQSKTRHYIAIDTPGHAQYTRNMATGASLCDLALIMVDVRKGVLEQTRRHGAIVSLMGIGQIMVLINKMDLAGYSEAEFEAIKQKCIEQFEGLDFTSITVIPVSAVYGDNIVHRSQSMDWYKGPTVFEALEAFEHPVSQAKESMVVPVQYVMRHEKHGRIYTGQLVSGEMRAGDEVTILPGNVRSAIQHIIGWDADIQNGRKGESIAFTLANDVDVSRGDVICSPDAACKASSIFRATIIWCQDSSLVTGRSYRYQGHHANSLARVGHVHSILDVKNRARLAGRHIHMNDIGEVDLYLDNPVVAMPYKESKTLGSFILIDTVTHEVAAIGMIQYAMRRNENIHRQDVFITPEARAGQKGQKSCVIWMTGLSGAGKSTIANALEQKLFVDGRHSFMLDGDNVRLGLNKDLGFGEEDRTENIRRVAEVAKLMADAGLIVIVSFISPFEADRRKARDIIGSERFIETYVDVPIEVAEARDPKGLYKKARSGDIPNFTGINSPYEVPLAMDIHLPATQKTPEVLADKVIKYLRTHGLIV